MGILNTYFSLCAAVLASFAFSAATNKRNKFVMEHIQNATLAGGVAIGACADLVVQAYGCLIVGAFAGVVSTLGYDYITPWLAKKMHTHDTCGVHNLHGVLAINEGKQAVNQLIASVLTFVIAITGGGLTGLLLRWVRKWQNLDSAYYKGMTVLKLIQSVGKIAGGTIDQSMMVNPSDNYFDDSLFFEVHEDGEDDESVDELENNKKNIYPVLKGQSTGTYSQRSTLSTGAYSNNGYN